MGKYKVGDKVRVRKDLRGDFYYKGNDEINLYTNFNMTEFAGKELTIDKIDNHWNYLVKENSCSWCDEMLEDVEPDLSFSEIKEILNKKEDECSRHYSCGTCSYSNEKLKVKGYGCYFFRDAKNDDFMDIMKQYKKFQEEHETEWKLQYHIKEIKKNDPDNYVFVYVCNTVEDAAKWCHDNREHNFVYEIVETYEEVEVKK